MKIFPRILFILNSSPYAGFIFIYFFSLKMLRTFLYAPMTNPEFPFKHDHSLDEKVGLESSA